MEFRTKREAEEAIQRLEQRARGDARAETRALANNSTHMAGEIAKRRVKAEAEAARIRALLPTLEE